MDWIQLPQSLTDTVINLRFQTR